MPHSRGLILAFKELGEAVTAENARKVHLVCERLRFVFGMRLSEIHERLQKAIPTLELRELDALLDEGEQL